MTTIEYIGKGSIEFNIPSGGPSIKLKSGEKKAFDKATPEDVKVFRELASLGIRIVSAQGSDPTPVTAETQPTATQESEQPEQTQYTEKELMAKTAQELKDLAKANGITVPEGASKAEITKLILAK